MECSSPYCERDISQATRHNLWEPYCSRYCEVYHRSGRRYDGRLTDTQIEIFEALQEKKSFPSRSALADYIGKTRATVNESVGNMERYGWVTILLWTSMDIPRQLNLVGKERHTAKMAYQITGE